MVRKIVLLTLLLLLAACDETILHQLTEQQANKAFIVLSRAGIESKKETDGVSWTLRVAKQDASTALSELEAARLFVPEKEAEPDSGFGFIQSAEQRAHAIEESQSRKVADTLKRIPGILDARVHLFRAKRDLLEAPGLATQGSASVLLIVDIGLVPENEAVKSLVAGALGLEATAVSVIVSESKIASDPPKDIAPKSSSQNLQATTVQTVEDTNNTWSPRSVYLFTMFISLAIVLGVLFYSQRRSKAFRTTVANQEDSSTLPLSVLDADEVF